jgi:hypothetical protein
MQAEDACVASMYPWQASCALTQGGFELQPTEWHSVAVSGYCLTHLVHEWLQRHASQLLPRCQADAVKAVTAPQQRLILTTEGVRTTPAVLQGANSDSKTTVDSQEAHLHSGYG